MAGPPQQKESKGQAVVAKTAVRPKVVTPHRFSADLQAWGHNRMAAIEKANALRRERDETCLGSFPGRSRPTSAPAKPDGFKTYPIMQVISTIPTQYLPCHPYAAKKRSRPRHMHEMVDGQPVIP
eukprot:symbB.v1.2.000345.t1/scaffold22.1/size431876/13